MVKNGINPASFRDPSGFIFLQDGKIYRQVNSLYRQNYDHLMSSGLYQNLVEAGLLIPHREASLDLARSEEAYKILEPQPVPFISYPYEWCFSQLKEAARVTIAVQKRALQYKMSLKDSSAYNIQFIHGAPVLIDTLSFEKYREGDPWIAYRQFCQNFVAPLALMSRKDVRLNQLFRIYIDGIPLDLASSLLPLLSHFKISLLTHIHLHARSQKHYGGKTLRKSDYKMGHFNFLALLDNLESCIEGMEWNPEGTEWGNYYESTNYTGQSMHNKKQIVADLLDRISSCRVVWDLGANTGLYSRILPCLSIVTSLPK